MGEKIYFVYIMTNLHNTALYSGVTNDLFRRVQEHKNGDGGKFSRRYKMKKLVYSEIYCDVRFAIAREIQIKGGSRMDKLKLISTINPIWLDLILDIE